MPCENFPLFLVTLLTVREWGSAHPKRAAIHTATQKERARNERQGSGERENLLCKPRNRKAEGKFVIGTVRKTTANLAIPVDSLVGQKVFSEIGNL